MNCLLPLSALSVSAALAAGLGSTVHCTLMCGGLAGALGLRSPSGPRRRRLLDTILYQAGRLLSYSLLGALAGTAGSLFLDAALWARLSGIARLLAAGVVIALGINMIRGARPWAAPTYLGTRLFRHIAPLAGRLPHGPLASLGLGGIWGLMPCGMLYSMLALAALSAQPLAGAAMMLSFGIGTLPAITTLLVGVPLLRRRSRRAGRCAGALMLTFGLWSAASAGVGTFHTGAMRADSATLFTWR